MSGRQRGVGQYLLAGLLGFLSALPAAAQTTASSSGAIEIASLNGTYTDLKATPQPIEQGPLTVRLSSPQHEITVHRNRLALLPRGEGVFAASLEVEFEGNGQIFADLETVAGSNRLQDKVRLPRQTVRASGLMRPTWSAEGLRMTVVEAPASIALVIESGIATNLVTLCQSFEALPLFAPDCAAFATSLQRVNVPLPRAGETFLLPREELSPSEQAFFAANVPAAPAGP